MIHVLERTVDPVSAPAELGQHYLNTVSGSMWFSKGTSAVGDWVLMAPTPVTSISVTAPITTTGGATPTIALTAPTTSAIAASAIDWALLGKTGGLYTKTLSANTTFTFSNVTAGYTIVVRLTNTASNYTVTWPTVKWPGNIAPVMTIGAKSDIYTFIYDGTNIFGTVVPSLG